MGERAANEGVVLEPIISGFVRCEVPASELWRALDGSSKGHGAAAIVRPCDIRRAIEVRLEGRTSDAQLAVWAGCLLAFSCFHVEGRAARAALTRLSLSEVSEIGLRSLVARLVA